MPREKVYSIELSRDEAQQFVAMVKEAEQEDGEKYLHNVSECYDNVLVQIVCRPNDLQYFNAMVAQCW